MPCSCHAARYEHIRDPGADSCSNQGALGFDIGPEPPAPQNKFNKTPELEEMNESADSIIAGEEFPEGPEAGQVEFLMLIGTSMGGARPKAAVEVSDDLRLAEFNRGENKWNHARVARDASACRRLRSTHRAEAHRECRRSRRSSRQAA